MPVALPDGWDQGHVVTIRDNPCSLHSGINGQPINSFKDGFVESQSKEPGVKHLFTPLLMPTGYSFNSEHIFSCAIINRFRVSLTYRLRSLIHVDGCTSF